ncbi:MAG: aldehyde dehydrogenase family protein [Bacteroidota bacterium]
MEQAIGIKTGNLDALFETQRTRALELRTEPVKKRKELLLKLKTWLLANREGLQQAVYADFRKPALEVETSELFPVIGEISHTLEHLDEWVKPKKVDAPITYIGTRSEIRFEPKGTCLIIAPWNYPFNLCIGPLVSCLAAGNTAVVKPSEMTPNTADFIEKLVNEVFEESRVAVVQGDADTASALLKLPFDHIFFTGSPAVGKVVMRAAAENLASVTLELGGKSPAIIDASADLKDAAKRIAFGKFLNNGQTCIAPDYILIEEHVREPFLKLLDEQVKNVFGNGKRVDEQAPDYTRIVNQRHFQRLHRLVQDAIQRGAKPVVTGEANASTNFFPPTVLVDVPFDSLVMEEEIFGPVLPVIGLPDISEAVRIINQKPKPLGLYIFSYRSKFRETVLQQTSAGAVVVNDCVLQFTHPNVPFGGVNNSGIGKAHGLHGFLSFSNEKPVIRQKKGFANAYFFYPPYTPLKKKLVNFLLRWIL